MRSIRSIGRRRFLTIAAAAGGLALLAPGMGTGTGGAVAAEVAPTEWRGRALGAEVRLILNHPDPARAAALIRATTAELARLERIFTLYDAGSDLSRLNREGYLIAPPSELVEALHLARAVHAVTGGRFDPSVQPLWLAYAAGADAQALAQARARVGLDGLRISAARISLRAGMALTLNGIAQGYITDRITALLRAGGAQHTLVDMGEFRAIGGRAPGQPWRIGLGGSGSGFRSGSVDGAEVVALTDRALAVSEAAGFSFDAAGRLPHLIDPARGEARAEWARIAVLADSAALADALSTGLSLADEGAIRAALSAPLLAGVEVRADDAAQARRLRLRAG